MSAICCALNAARGIHLALPLLSILASANHVVRPDRHWLDTDGNRIEAHGAGMLQSPVDGRWYWYGESRKTDDLWDRGITCYSSETIAGPWKFEGRVFAQGHIKQKEYGGPYAVERPKVLYNAATKKYVMWFHLDDFNYNYRCVGVAQSDSPTGPFEYIHGLRPDGLKSLDMSLFQDPLDGQAYFIRSVDNRYVGISRLSGDYLFSTGVISRHSVFEGMALFRHPNGTYYIVASHLTGWNPNPLMVFRAAGSTLDDPQWVPLGNPTASNTSMNTQPTYVVQYRPSSGPPYFVYMADNWLYCDAKHRGLARIEQHEEPHENSALHALIDACYVWLPIEFLDHNITIRFRNSWNLEHPFADTYLPLEEERLQRDMHV